MVFHRGNMSYIKPITQTELDIIEHVIYLYKNESMSGCSIARTLGISVSSACAILRLNIPGWPIKWARPDSHLPKDKVRTCNKCGLSLPITSFSKGEHIVSGYVGTCKKCTNTRVSQMLKDKRIASGQLNAKRINRGTMEWDERNQFIINEYQSGKSITQIGKTLDLSYTNHLIQLRRD